MPEPKDAKEEKGNLPEEVTKVLEEIKVNLEKNNAPKEDPVAKAPTYADQRAGLQKRLGFTDEQMAAHEEMLLRSQAPVIERTAWASVEKKADIDTYRSEMEKELSIYPQERRTPELMDKIYYYVRGKHSESKPKDEPKKGPTVETRISRGPGYDGMSPGTGGREEAAATNEDLDDREKFVAAKMGISEKDYAKSRNAGRAIRELRVPDERPASSTADIELRRMTGRR
jgi:hypothetical protein